MFSHWAMPQSFFYSEIVAPLISQSHQKLSIPLPQLLNSWDKKCLSLCWLLQKTFISKILFCCHCFSGILCLGLAWGLEQIMLSVDFLCHPGFSWSSINYNWLLLSTNSVSNTETTVVPGCLQGLPPELSLDGNRWKWANFSINCQHCNSSLWTLLTIYTFILFHYLEKQKIHYCSLSQCLTNYKGKTTLYEEDTW